MSFAYLSKFFKNQAKNIKTSIEQATVILDRGTASQSEIDVIEDQFNDLTIKLGEASVVLETEKAEAEKVRTKFNKYMVIAEDLNTKIKNNIDVDTNTIALNEAIQILEKIKPTLTKEENDVVEALAEYNDIKETLQILKDKLLNSQNSNSDAVKEMERAERRKARAEIKAENAALRSGLRTSADVLGAATKATLQIAEKHKIDAIALETKAEMLNGGEEDIVKSDVLKDMLADKTTTDMSLSDRLNNLK